MKKYVVKKNVIKGTIHETVETMNEFMKFCIESSYLQALRHIFDNFLLEIETFIKCMNIVLKFYTRVNLTISSHKLEKFMKLSKTMKESIIF